MLKMDIWFKDGFVRAFPKVDTDNIIVDNNNMAFFIYGDKKKDVFINLNNVNCIERYNIEKEEEIKAQKLDPI